MSDNKPTYTELCDELNDADFVFTFDPNDGKQDPSKFKNNRVLNIFKKTEYYGGKQKLSFSIWLIDNESGPNKLGRQEFSLKMDISDAEIREYVKLHLSYFCFGLNHGMEWGEDLVKYIKRQGDK